MATIEEDWDEDWLCELDKAWDAIHRILGDGTVEGPQPQTPLSKAVHGGRPLSDSCSSFLSTAETCEVAEALSRVEEKWFRSRFGEIVVATDYAGPGDADDLEYAWSYFQAMREFFTKAASAGRAVVFNA